MENFLSTTHRHVSRSRRWSLVVVAGLGHTKICSVDLLNEKSLRLSNIFRNLRCLHFPSPLIKTEELWMEEVESFLIVSIINCIALHCICMPAVNSVDTQWLDCNSFRKQNVIFPAICSQHSQTVENGIANKLQINNNYGLLAKAILLPDRVVVSGQQSLSVWRDFV